MVLVLVLALVKYNCRDNVLNDKMMQFKHFLIIITKLLSFLKADRYIRNKKCWLICDENNTDASLK